MKRGAIFTPETFRFFRDVKRNNHKRWMDANRERYRAQVVEPFRHLLARVGPPLQDLGAEIEVNGRTGVNFSRINRDIRFAKVKLPYRTLMYLMLPESRAPETDDCAFYVNVGLEAVTAGVRFYGTQRTSRLRTVIAPRAVQQAAWLRRQARRLGRGYESYWHTTQRGDWVKVPGWPQGEGDWKRVQAWIARRSLSHTAATRPGFDREVIRVFRDLYPLFRFATAEHWQA
ncbi:MAG: DUF2461 family protein [Candidatus Acidiferrales bacterium]